jgi:hypothetical protein
MPPCSGLRRPRSNDHAGLMRRLLCWSLLLMLVGCKAHQPPDQAVQVRLRAVVVSTCADMGLGEAQRPSGRALDDQIGLLAMRVTTQRLEEIDQGKLNRAVVVDAYRAALARRAERRSPSDPPKLLVHLVERQSPWSIDQTLLAAALLSQYEHEAKLTPAPPALPR